MGMAAKVVSRKRSKVRARQMIQLKAMWKKYLCSLYILHLSVIYPEIWEIKRKVNTALTLLPAKTPQRPFGKHPWERRVHFSAAEEVNYWTTSLPTEQIFTDVHIPRSQAPCTLSYAGYRRALSLILQSRSQLGLGKLALSGFDYRVFEIHKLTNTYTHTNTVQ